MDVLVTGAHGQLGYEIRNLAAHYPDLRFHSFSRSELDISDAPSVQKVFDQKQIRICINCAAYTKVDRAEEEVIEAYAINARAVEVLAKTCATAEALLIHYSTDYVYDNGLTRPLRETDPLNPQSVYAKSKLKGEQCAIAANPRTLILRTSWVYSAHGHNFIKTILRLADERDTLTIVNDQIGFPTYAYDLARATLDIVSILGKNPDPKLFGIYNYANAGQVTWYTYAQELCTLAGKTCTISPVTSAEFKTAARRPPYSVLDLDLIKKTFNVDIPDWQDSLRNCLEKLGALAE